MDSSQSNAGSNQGSSANTSFVDLGVSESICTRLSQKGILNPTPIQREVFGPITQKESLIGFSKTGTGKTLAYLIPLVSQFDQTMGSGQEAGIFGLVLVPTRELAAQVSRDLELIGGESQKGVVIVGGESENDQIRLGREARWVIATPGRLLDLLQRKAIDLNQVKAVVFDEADRLLDMGFVDDMRAILKFIPRGQAQLLFFSATVHFGIDEMAYEFGIENLKKIGKETDELTVDGLDHRISFVGDDEKFHALVHFLKNNSGRRGIVFSNFRDKAGYLGQKLRGLGARVEVLTAQATQPQRTFIMENFRNGKISVLIASDLAARGLDVSDLDFVVNFDLPEDPATYVHRVGRTARAGRKGVAISFVGFEDSFRLEKLEKFLGIKLERMTFKSEELSGKLPLLGSIPQVGPRSNPGPKLSTPTTGRDYRDPSRDHQARRHSPDFQKNSPKKDVPRSVDSKFDSSFKVSDPKPFWQRIISRLLRLLGIEAKHIDAGITQKGQESTARSSGVGRGGGPRGGHSGRRGRHFGGRPGRGSARGRGRR